MPLFCSALSCKQKHVLIPSLCADYHRFHSPVSGTVRSITAVPGQLYTVNPIAVNSPLVNVFTSNKRIVVLIDSPAFGLVAFVAVGATLVGSIVMSVAEGQSVTKGDELGYFAFGGSTCIVLIGAAQLHLDSDLQRMSARCVSRSDVPSMQKGSLRFSGNVQHCTSAVLCSCVSKRTLRDQAFDYPTNCTVQVDRDVCQHGRPGGSAQRPPRVCCVCA